MSDTPAHRTPGSGPAYDLAAMRARVAADDATGYWRGLEEVADTAEFRAWVEDEFPDRASLLSLDRRRFLKFMGASLALAGLSGCRFLPQRRAVPFVDAVEDQVPGLPVIYATSVTLSGIATGVLARTHEGRPTKLEGNPLHPASLGGTDAQTQAALLDLYDPDRSRTALRHGEIASWEDFLRELRTALSVQRARRGAGLRILSGAITSPTMATLMGRVHASFPEARWYQWEAVNRDSVLDATVQAFGRPLNPVHRLSSATVLLALDADVLSAGPGHVRHARDFMAGRRLGSGRADMNRLYAVESIPSNTGATADHRLPVRHSEVHAVAVALAREIGLPLAASSVTGLSEARRRWVSACARDLLANRGRAVIIAGDRQPPAVHVLAAALNEVLGAVGKTVYYTEPIYADWQRSMASIRALGQEMAGGHVDALLLMGANPVYDAPADAGFAEGLRRVRFTAHLGQRRDETAALCTWHVPEAHELESWGDARAYDGTVSLLQPLIEPLFGGKSALEVTSVIAGRPSEGYEALRAGWRARSAGVASLDAFRRAIHDGVVEGSELPPVAATVRQDALRRALQVPDATGGLEVNFAPDPSLYDGRFANNGWLQELPKAITRLTWDNAAFIAPATAGRLGIADGDELRISSQGRTLLAPARLQPGHPAEALTLHLGGGREMAGSVGSGVGFSVGALRTTDQPWSVAGAEVGKTGASHRFANTEHHHPITGGRLDGQQGRDIVRVVGLSALADATGSGAHKADEQGFYDGTDHHYDGYAWGMSIDLTLCTGCNACVIACQAENNIPVVGKEQVARGREMHWLRIDRYYEGDVDDPAVHHQPVLCMHCEQAPCEPVCPVAATVHSHEGLNQMVYNRCVGTRYCSNNCPYKVRRFNFLNYANHEEPPLLQLLRNPNVTVRGRGVMEKCTFCVQRISAARIAAEKDDRRLRDGDVVTACQAACPPRAIVFGDISDGRSAVSVAKSDPRDYSLLEELNTRPRLTYLAKVVNPNPEMPTAQQRKEVRR